MSERDWEREWLTGEEARELLDLAVQDYCPRVRDYTGRKFRLYSCACCRRIWHLLTFPGGREVVELAEKYADGLVTFEAMDGAAAGLYEALWAVPRDERGRRADCTAAFAAFNAGWSDPRQCHGQKEGAGYVVSDARQAVYLDMRWDQMTPEAFMAERDRLEPAECDLVRCVFGNPFRPFAFDPDWQTPTVAGLAQGMYESREFAHMPILADALEDAGCTNADILTHCRGPGPHARGCWVVDLVLGKD